MRSAFLVYIHLSSVRQSHPAIHGYLLKSGNKMTYNSANRPCRMRFAFQGKKEMIEQNTVHDRTQKRVMQVHDPF